MHFDEKAIQGINSNSSSQQTNVDTTPKYKKNPIKQFKEVKAYIAEVAHEGSVPAHSFDLALAGNSMYRSHDFLGKSIHIPV